MSFPRTEDEAWADLQEAINRFKRYQTDEANRRRWAAMSPWDKMKEYKELLGQGGR